MACIAPLLLHLTNLLYLPCCPLYETGKWINITKIIEHHNSWNKCVFHFNISLHLNIQTFHISYKIKYRRARRLTCPVLQHSVHLYVKYYLKRQLLYTCNKRYIYDWNCLSINNVHIRTYGLEFMFHPIYLKPYWMMTAKQAVTYITDAKLRKEERKVIGKLTYNIVSFHNLPWKPAEHKKSFCP